MTDTHDQGSINATSVILEKTRSGDNEFKQIFSTEFSRTGYTGWPEPDSIFRDNLNNNEITLALEFKPPNQEKREYMTGIGQSISYLYNNDYAGLILPKMSKDGFPISRFIKELFDNRRQISQLPICIYDYDPKTQISENNLSLIKPIKHLNDQKIERKVAKGAPVFWSWWRDMSNYELHQILSLCRKYNDKNADIYTDYVWPEFKKILENGNALDWEGNKRNRKSIPSGEKQNYKIPLFQLDFINQDTGHLTQLGYRFFNLAEQKGSDSKIFLNALANHVLTKGKHMQLINIQYFFQEKLLKKNTKFNSSKFKEYFDNYLIKIGQVPPWESRKPGRKTTGAKNNYIRDEFKLWNKLGLLISDKKRYFRDNYGIQFNWPKILECYKFDVGKYL